MNFFSTPFERDSNLGGGSIYPLVSPIQQSSRVSVSTIGGYGGYLVAEGTIMVNLQRKLSMNVNYSRIVPVNLTVELHVLEICPTQNSPDRIR